MTHRERTQTHASSPVAPNNLLVLSLHVHAYHDINEHVLINDSFVPGLEDPAADVPALLEHDGAPCKNKPCVRRGAMEDKLLAKWEQVNTELGAKVKGVQKLRRSVRKHRGKG